MNTRRSTRTRTQTQQSPKRKQEDSSESDSSSDSDSINASVVTVIQKNKQDGTKKPSPKRKHESESEDEGSSSDSSVGDYLKNPDEIDLSSSFFTATSSSTIENPPDPPDFNSIEKRIFGGIQRLSDDSSSSSEEEEEEIEENIPQTQEITQKINFSQLREYNRKIEEAKACVQKYEENKKPVKKSSTNTNTQEITKLLKLGETKNETHHLEDEFEDSEDENEAMEWEEIEVTEKTEADKVNIPKNGVQITVELPQTIRKKSKGIDMMTAIKRRINRVKKENQVYVHKVHLLCWIAHGKYINSILNDTELLASALSLLPSDKCYPPKHADMSYLEQIVKWFGKFLKIIPKTEDCSVKEALQKAISNKTACCNRDFVLIFIIILRSLGLQCRLIFSLQCLPLRPPSSELCSLSTKQSENNPSSSNSSKSSKEATENKPSSSKSSKKATTKPAKTLNKSVTNSKDKKAPRKKSSDPTKKPQENKTRRSSRKPTNNPELKISQVDGADDEEPNKKRNKPSIRIKLKKNLNDSVSSTSELSTINNKKKKLLEVEDDDFKPKRRSPNKSPKDVNGNKRSARSSKSEEPETPEASSSLKKTPVAVKLEASSSTSSSLKKTPIQVKSEESSSSKKTPVLVKSEASSSLNKTSIQVKSEESSSLKKTPVPVKSEASSSSKKTPVPIKTEASSKRRSIPVKAEASSSSTNNLKTEPSPPSKSTISFSPRRLRDKLRLNKPKIEITTPKPKSSPSSTSSSSSNYFNKKPSKTSVTADIINLIKGDMSQKRISEKQLKVKTTTKTKKEESDYDSDYFPDADDSEPIEKPAKKRRSSNNYSSENEFKFKTNTNIKRKTKNKVDNRAVSTEDEESSQDSGKKKKTGNDIWVEVFLEEEEKWISVDLIKGQIHCVSELHSRASQPVSYILAWNNDLSIKDVTARYCPNWNTVTRKLRVDSAWWQQSLRPYLGVKTARDKEEDEDLARQQLDKPLPTTISEYKNHPLYALKRHLLKFEGIYPPNALTLGFVRNEAVYARECVHTLHSREIWVKHAKVVKPKQEPYKIVKARPKYDKLTGNMITDLPLELFGSWQVEDYVPPTAENGVVPRNAFGNVELFKACMLPKKTVHLQLPGLNKVCRKLRIDCAPAVVGFDFHSGFSHPMFDGYVVCEEFKDTLIAAWEQDQLETAKKEQEKYEKRVWGNWRKLIKAALIRERLKARYDFGPVVDNTKKSKKKSKGSKVVFKKLKISNDDDDDCDWTDVE